MVRAGIFSTHHYAFNLSTRIVRRRRRGGIPLQCMTLIITRVLSLHLEQEAEGYTV
jgi:hypothetical protein